MVEREDRADVLLITGSDVASDTTVLALFAKEIATLALEPEEFCKKNVKLSEKIQIIV